MKCKSCETESPATLCNICFLDEIIGAIAEGEEDPSRILKRMVVKYGRLKHLKSLPTYQLIFGARKLRRVITTESGDRCKLIPTFDGWVAVSQGPKSEAVIIDTPEGKVTRYPGQSAEGGRVISYYKGDLLVKEVHVPTSLVILKRKGSKRTKYITSGPPSPHYKSPKLD